MIKVSRLLIVLLAISGLVDGNDDYPDDLKEGPRDKRQMPGRGLTGGSGQTPGGKNIRGKNPMNYLGQASGTGHIPGRGHTSGTGKLPGRGQNVGVGHTPGRGHTSGTGHLPGKGHHVGLGQTSGRGHTGRTGHIPGKGHTSGVGHLPGKGHNFGQMLGKGYTGKKHGQTPPEHFRGFGYPDWKNDDWLRWTQSNQDLWNQGLWNQELWNQRLWNQGLWNQGLWNQEPWNQVPQWNPYDQTMYTYPGGLLNQMLAYEMSYPPNYPLVPQGPPFNDYPLFGPDNKNGTYRFFLPDGTIGLMEFHTGDIPDAFQGSGGRWWESGVWGENGKSGTFGTVSGGHSLHGVDPNYPVEEEKTSEEPQLIQIEEEPANELIDDTVLTD